MEGAASKRNLPHWAAGLPALIWVQQDALGLSCKNSNWWWMQTQCENNFVHWTNAKQPIVFTNPWPIFSAVLSLLLFSLPSEAQRKMFYVWQCGTYDMSWDKVESSLRLCYVSVLQPDTGANKRNHWGFLSGLVCHVFWQKHHIKLTFDDKPYSNCFRVVILKRHYSCYVVNEKIMPIITYSKLNDCKGASLRCFSACGHYIQEVQ